MTTIQLTPNLAAFIDEAGALDQEIKRLTKQLDTMKAKIKAEGAGDFGGFVFNVKVIDSDREITDWKTIAEKFQPSYQLISAHTTKSIVQSIRFVKA